MSHTICLLIHFQYFSKFDFIFLFSYTFLSGLTNQSLHITFLNNCHTTLICTNIDFVESVKLSLAGVHGEYEVSLITIIFCWWISFGDWVSYLRLLKWWSIDLEFQFTTDPSCRKCQTFYYQYKARNPNIFMNWRETSRFLQKNVIIQGRIRFN